MGLDKQFFTHNDLREVASLGRGCKRLIYVSDNEMGRHYTRAAALCPVFAW